jgi:hypothetical protein
VRGRTSIRSSPAVPSSAMNEVLVPWLMAPPEAAEAPLTLEDFLHRPVWHQRGACRGVGPASYVRGPKTDYGRARELCEGCPVRLECLEVVLADPDLVGLSGRRTRSDGRSGGGGWRRG